MKLTYTRTEPMSAVMFIPVCPRTGQVVILHRHPDIIFGNTWSFPTGTHDIGETIEDIISKEAREELNLAVYFPATLIGIRENLGTPATPQHTVMPTYVVRADFTHITNQEPHKHDAIEIVHFTDLFRHAVLSRQLAPGLHSFLRVHRVGIISACATYSL